MKILIHPGWQNSGPDHWQSHWQSKLRATRVQHEDWARPRRQAWLDGLHATLTASSHPVALICHSLGCITLAHYAWEHPDCGHKIKAAWFVAPADVEREHAPEPLHDFRPTPSVKLPFASRVIASDNDPFCTLVRAREFAENWGSEFDILENAGHVNTESGFGAWPEGMHAFTHWIKTVAC